MLVLFFTIIFIAELIITIQLIALIQNARTGIQSLNKNVTDIKPVLFRNICDIRIVLNTILLKLNGFYDFVDQKKEDYKKIFSANLLTRLASFIIANDWKKIITAIEIILRIKKLLAK